MEDLIQVLLKGEWQHAQLVCFFGNAVVAEVDGHLYLSLQEEWGLVW